MSLEMQVPRKSTIKSTYKRTRAARIVHVDFRQSKTWPDTFNMWIEYELRTKEAIFQIVSPRADWILRRIVKRFNLHRRNGQYNFKRIEGKECRIYIRSAPWNGPHGRRDSFYAELKGDDN